MSSRAAGCLALALAFVWAPLRADVSFTERISSSGLAAVEGGGVMETKVVISAGKQRTDSMGKSGAALAALEKVAAAGSEIVALEEGKVYRIDATEKSYTDESLDERRERIRRISAKMAPPLIFKDVTSQIEPTGNQTDVGGLPCDEIIVTVSGNVEDPATKQSRPVTLRGEIWVTPSFPGKGEIEAFRRKYAELLGFDPLARRQALMAARKYAAVLQEYAKEASKVGGFAIRETLTLSGIIPIATKPVSDRGRDPAGQGSDPAAPPVVAAPMGRSPTPLGSPGRRLVTRGDVEGAGRSQRPGTGAEWILTRQIVGIDQTPADPGLFQPPAGFKKLVPKSRRPEKSSPAPVPAVSDSKPATQD